MGVYPFFLLSIGNIPVSNKYLFSGADSKSQKSFSFILLCLKALPENSSILGQCIPGVLYSYIFDQLASAVCISFFIADIIFRA